MSHAWSGMQALSHGDRERCRSLLFDARSNAVKLLAAVSMESVSNVNPAILKLQQLQCLQEAWKYKWPSLSLSTPPSPIQVTPSHPAHHSCLQIQPCQSLSHAAVSD